MEIDKVYYYDRNGNLKLTLNEHPYWLDGGEFKNWEWGYDEGFNRFKNFHRSKKEYPLNITIVDEDKASRDALCDIFDEDVMAGAPGYLMINNWKLPCYVVEAERSIWAQALDWQVEFKVITETSTWIRETTTSYNGVIAEELDVDLGRDYSLETGDTVAGRGYEEGVSGSFSYLIDEFGNRLIDGDGNYLIDGDASSDGKIGYGYSVVTDYNEREIILPNDGNGFRVVFYGATTNPVIYLNGKPVAVNTTLADGERLVLTSNGKEKSIYKYNAVGEKTDAFIYRDKTNSPFFSIGKDTELSYGEIKFDFTTIETRSEPSWI